MRDENAVLSPGGVMLEFAVATAIAVVCIDVVGAALVLVGLVGLWRDRRRPVRTVGDAVCDAETDPFMEAYVTPELLSDSAPAVFDREHRRAGYWS